MNRTPRTTDELPSIVYDERGNPIDTSQLKNTPADTTQPQFVYMTRPHEPLQQQLSEEMQQKSAASKRTYPYLNLSEGEYVISAIRRHPIGLFQIWSVVLLAILLLMAGASILMSGDQASSSLASTGQMFWLAMMFLGIVVFIFLGGIIATVVYEGNKFFLTNESVTQHIQTGLFSKKEQTINLNNIEDASFRKHGIIQEFFNYGSLRLSTQGDETTYRFNYVAKPSVQVALLNNAVEAYKSGRPVESDN